ncbi:MULTISPECIES: sensor histidine kinase [Bacillaceae]|uniref:histidine kinase n=1 Tax=Evansella alkalicola TaxID=745819 RepID=A0ABS6JXC1_9BACI|nr:HAMP domain-containing sensor histidine kinase [Litchfieldia alkalitelluris]MBU9721872.1 HAMP domain-containing histidine kinase [Bacillus alkalicola]
MELYFHYLLNVFIILTPTFIYATFWKNHTFNRFSNANSITLFISCVCVSILTIILSVESYNGVPFDLRFVPLFIGTMMGGPIIGTGILGVQVLFHILTHGFDYIAYYLFSLISGILILLSGIIYHKYYSLWSHTKRFLYITIVFFAIPLLIFLMPTSLLTMPKVEGFYTILFFSATHIPTILITLTIIEKIKMNAKLQKDLEKSEQLRVVSELAASVAHEVRNPMTVARGFIQLIHSRSNLTSDEKKYLLLTISELDRAQSIISDYLSLAKPDDKTHSPVSVFKVMDKVRHTIQAYALMNNVSVEIAVPQNLSILGNEKELTQVVLNITKNGIEAMESGGVLTLTAELRDDHVDISIKDTGQGMSKEQLKQLGNAYFTTKEKGTGLGLMISYNIIHSWGGTVSVQSKKGEGTEFIIHLPLLSEAPEHQVVPPIEQYINKSGDALHIGRDN